MTELEKILLLKFSNKKLLLQAITHSSMNADNNYERLEFLGDNVVNLIASKMLFHTYGNGSEGLLSKKKAALVSGKSLAKIARSINLDKYVISNLKELSDSVISDVFEALVGALYLDQGLEFTQSWVSKLFVKFALTPDAMILDYKSMLQEQTQNFSAELPKYIIDKTSGPDHDKTFIVRCYLYKGMHTTGEGKTRKEAEQEAAKLMLINLGVIS